MAASSPSAPQTPSGSSADAEPQSPPKTPTVASYDAPASADPARAESDPPPATSPPTGGSPPPADPPPAEPGRPTDAAPAPTTARVKVYDDGPPADLTAGTASASRQLPPHKGKKERIQEHFGGAKDALTDWIELRIAVIRREIEEKVEELQRKIQTLAQAWGITAVLGLAAALMSLFLLGFFFSALFGTFVLPPGHGLWALTLGFLTLVLLLGIGALIFLRRARRITDELTSDDKDVTPSDDRSRAARSDGRSPADRPDGSVRADRPGDSARADRPTDRPHAERPGGPPRPDRADDLPRADAPPPADREAR